MHQIVPLDMQATPSQSVQAKAIIVGYTVFCFLLYGIGVSILNSVPTSLFGDILIKVSGLLLIFTGPGLFIAFLSFRKKYALTEYIAIGFGLNLLLLPSIVVLIEFVGLPTTAGLAVSAIALLTFIAAAIWISLDRPVPTLREIKATFLRFSLSALCLLAIVLIYPREVLTPIDRYVSDVSFVEFVDLLADRNITGLHSKAFIDRPKQSNRYKGSAPHILTWIYINNTLEPQKFSMMLLTNCGWLQLSHGESVEEGSPPGKILQVDELWVWPSTYYSYFKINTEFLDKSLPDRSRVYASEDFMLLPGENYIHISCFEAQHELRIVDLSTMDRGQLLDLVSEHYMVKAEPEVGDAQEAFLESKYATKAVSSVNPPLLYPIYRGVFEILGTSMSSIALLELFAFSLVFMMLSLIVAEAQPSLRLGPPTIAMAALMNYVIAITMLPVLHSAGGVFLLMFLAASWFLWRRDFVPAAGAFILMCLIRYEGVVLASLSLFAFLALADYQIRIRKYLLPALAAAGVMCFFVVSIWGVELFQSEALVERMHMLTLTDISVQRVLDYMQWALILACGMPIFWILIKKTDRLSIYYLLIAVLYFGFLCSLHYIRPYHLGPFALAAISAGTRAIGGVGDAAIRKMIMIGFFVLALGSLYLVLYHLPRQVPVPLP